jgi:hypothetical protein
MSPVQNMIEDLFVVVANENPLYITLSPLEDRKAALNTVIFRTRFLIEVRGFILGYGSPLPALCGTRMRLTYGHIPA